jgi:hypothetical protein
MNKYYLELPENYKLDKTIDAKNFLFGLLLNVLALVVGGIVFFITYILKFQNLQIPENDRQVVLQLLISILIVGLGFIVYIVLHELTHGLFYKYFTKQKLKFGLTLTVAYCGVPNVYVRKKETIIACLAPLVIYTILFAIIIIFLPPNIINLTVTLLFSLHVGGCTGDAYLSLVLLTKYKKDTYIKDTGPTQYIYKKGE